MRDTDDIRKALVRLAAAKEGDSEAVIELGLIVLGDIRRIADSLASIARSCEAQRKVKT